MLTRLKAALYLEAVLPVLPHLAAHDPVLAAALVGPDVAVALLAPGGRRTRLAVTAGRVTTSHTLQAGDLCLWFPTSNQLVRAFDGSGRAALALPVTGWHRLFRARRLVKVGERLEALLNVRDSAHLRLHVWGNLLVGVAAAAAWLRHHPSGPNRQARLHPGYGLLTCPDFPAPIWFDTVSLAWGVGEAPQAVAVHIHFAYLDLVREELDNLLDGPAAIGLGTVRITGMLPLAEDLGLIMQLGGNLLKPS